jgi:hypothetical protein
VPVSVSVKSFASNFARCLRSFFFLPLLSSLTLTLSFASSAATAYCEVPKKKGAYWFRLKV